MFHNLKLIAMIAMGMVLQWGAGVVSTVAYAALQVEAQHLADSRKDKDGDGLTDAEEKRLSTNARRPDTDGDGLVDGDEVHIYKTDPLRKDSDQDGLSDLDEIIRFNTDPNDADSDDDKLLDGEELNTYHTDPTRPDTDGDGLLDGNEVHLLGTDPLKSDTDGDGVSDGEELLVNLSNALNQDSDGDGIADAMDDCPNQAEVINGFGDEDGCPDQIPEVAIAAHQTLVLEGVSFEIGQPIFTLESYIALDKLYRTLRDFPEIAIEIRGFADSIGSDQLNLKLSEERARAVLQYLQQRGIAAARLQVTGFGENNPIASNATESGRERNRRIEIYRTR